MKELHWTGKEGASFSNADRPPEKATLPSLQQYERRSDLECSYAPLL